MKKTLAIVLALVMVLCMVPVMGAHTVEQTLSNRSYDLRVWNADATEKYGEAEAANSVTAKYNYEETDAVATGKWSDDAKMAIVTVDGFSFNADDVESITIDGKELDVDSYADYKESIKAMDDTNGKGKVNFPVEMTKAGYTDTFVITVVSKTEGQLTDGSKVDLYTTETAKVTVKMVNTAAYKASETATITNIATSKGNVSTYIVGSKIYLDYVGKANDLTTAKVTFADENGKAFSAITYAYNPVVKQADDTYKAEINLISTVGAKEVKLDSSAAKFDISPDANSKTVKFELETKAAFYETKAYSIVVRENIKEDDPKGIYFAETTKTIAMGESFSPVVLGVKTGKVVAAELVIPKDTDKQVIDLNDDKDTVIGTREGIAYITATYTTDMGTGKTYTSSSMKVVVTLPGESIPAVEAEAEIYYVTCRNLNVRAGGSTSYKKVDMIHRGDAVKVVSVSNGWAKLADGTYVCAKYISK